jgi:radical SAM protein with 4Fe4S-binding SPASM domain
MPISDPQDFFIQFHLTERCNLRCRHCYQTGGHTAELSLAEIIEVLDEVAEMLADWRAAYGLEFSPSFNVTGGEPFLREELFEIIAAMTARGFATYLLTNGTLIDKTRAQRLAGLGVKGVQVSLEGPAEIHDQIRGAGSFAASRQGIGQLLAAGLTVTLNATLSEMNAGYFREMVEYAGQLGVQRLGFSRLVPSGRGLGLLDRMLAPARLSEIYAEIFAMAPQGLEIVTGDPVASRLRGGDGCEDLGSVATGGCAAGLSGLTLLPDGTVTPCRRLAIPLGNVREDSLREIWANSEVLERLRDRRQYRGKCGSCPAWAHCRGCRAIAYAHSQSRGEADYLADDPQCFF